MIVGRVKGATKVLGKSQGFLGLPVREDTLLIDTDGSTHKVLVTAWEPTPAEIEKIVQGAPIHLILWGEGHPPVMLEVGDVP